MSDANAQIASSTTQNALKSKITKKELLKFTLIIELMIFIEVGIPYALYYILRNFMREVWALLIPIALPFIIAMYGLIRRRRVDVMGGVIVLIFGLSAVMTLFKDHPDPRIQLQQKSAVSGIISIIVVLTLIPIKFGTFRMRPLGFYFLRDLGTGGTFGYINSKINLPGLTEDEPINERWERHWTYQYFRRGFIIMTVIWGFGFLVEIIIRYFIIFKSSLSIEQATLFVTILQNFWSLLISNLTFACIWWIKRRGNRMVNDTSASDKPLEL
ncbi:hypothetical protein RclHR1_00800012 [Rhizophagus clarus]|uniref:Uncharacterized protein n=1 Tax=Rhizophagus clarus TaxID=94130 RepID=A0A2Z6SAT2_9GLOM|nr:hypothetical protein RclHR1_00800012 [Rhizophagus clarus]GES80023.1 hypothetical protein GLOIN_2v1773059 [Rhizophagus clarus]